MTFIEKIKIAFHLFRGKYNHSIFIYMEKQELANLIKESEAEVDIQYRGMQKIHVYDILENAYKGISISKRLEAEREWEEKIKQLQKENL